MPEPIRTRCTQGFLIVTDQYIRVELAQIKQQTLSRAALTAVDSAMGVPSLFGMGGGTNLVFHGQGGERICAGLVKPSIAREIVSLLNK